MARTTEAVNAAEPLERGTLALRPLVRALRPRQWLKNGLLLIPLAFTLNLTSAPLVARTLAGIAIFCALSSAGYLLNDVADVEADRHHPTKRFRPIPSGLVPVSLALGLGLLLAAGGLAGAFVLGTWFGIASVAYLALTAAYTLWFKHQVLLDVFGLAAGFVVRAVAGAAAIDVPVSPWLYTATLLGALLIALGKRRSELVGLGTGASDHRRNLRAYTVELIDQLILVVSAAALMTYALYTFSADNLPRDHSMMLTVPVVLYGLFRYLFLVHNADSDLHGSPEDLLYKDRPMMAAVALWVLMSVTILYLGATR